MSNEIEFYSYPHVVAIGRRKMLVPLDTAPDKKPKEWEVYVRLVSGTSFNVAMGLTRKSSGKAMGRAVSEMGEATGCRFVTTSEAAIPFEHVARIYVDRQENEHVTVLEDSSGASYILERGGEPRCRSAVEIVAGTILQYAAQKGDA